MKQRNGMYYICIGFPPKLYYKLHDMASNFGKRQVSQLVRVAVHEYLKKLERELEGKK